MEKQREVGIEGYGKVVLVRPNIGVSKEGDWIYSKVFNEAIRKGIPPTAILQKQLEESGVWTNKEEKDLEKERTLLTKFTLALREEKDEEKRKPLKKNYLEAKDALFSTLMTKSSLFNHSAERKADDARTEYLILKGSYKEGGKEPVWKDEEEMLESDDSVFYSNLATEYVTFLTDLPLDFDSIPGEKKEDKKADEKKPEEKKVEPQKEKTKDSSSGK